MSLRRCVGDWVSDWVTDKLSYIYLVSTFVSYITIYITDYWSEIIQTDTDWQSDITLACHCQSKSGHSLTESIGY